MYNELTNLLPPEREKILSRDYVFRIVVITAVLVTALTGAAAVLLVPTYTLLNINADDKRIRLTAMESKLSSVDESTLSARLAILSNNTAALTALSNAPHASTVIRNVLAISRPGIVLSSFSYAPSAGNSGTLVISGSSGTRDALRSYQLALQGAPFARSATLPVSAYADDTDIAFTITVTLSL